MRWSVNGRCPCGGTYEDRLITARIASPVSGEVTTLDAVPQGACPQCGSRVYQASVLARLESVLKDDRGGSQ